MHHAVFGDISYSPDEQAWTGSCVLPVFAEYGRVPPDYHLLGEPAPEFNRGAFALTIQDDTGDRPSEPQINAFRGLLTREREVCRSVLMELIDAYRDFSGTGTGALLDWLHNQRQSWMWGWLANLVGPAPEALEDLKQAVRCTGVEISCLYLGDSAYIAFYFETIWGLETEHGLSVVYHPDKGTFGGDASAIFDIQEADNLNES
jgi:hypothetical protein